MDLINNFINWIINFNNSQPYVDLIVIFLVILGGFAAKRYIEPYFPKFPSVFSTLIIGTLFVIGYLILQKITGVDIKSDSVKYFLSYASATTLYEIFLKWFMIIIKFVPDFLEGIKDKYISKKNKNGDN